MKKTTTEKVVILWVAHSSESLLCCMCVGVLWKSQSFIQYMT